MVDEVRVLHGPNRTIGFHENFTTSSSATIQNLSNATNEWQHVTGYGAFGPTHLLDRFDRAVDLPRGWTLHKTSDGDEWRVGTLSPNYSAGPSSWPSGSKGAPSDWIVRTAPMLTHLIGPEIMIQRMQPPDCDSNTGSALRPHGMAERWRSPPTEVRRGRISGMAYRGTMTSVPGSIQRPHSTGIGSGMVPVRWEDVVGLGGSNRRSAICQRMGGC